jgi:hypothetical protein
MPKFSSASGSDQAITDITRMGTTIRIAIGHTGAVTPTIGRTIGMVDTVTTAIIIAIITGIRIDRIAKGAGSAAISGQPFFEQISRETKNPGAGYFFGLADSDGLVAG